MRWIQGWARLERTIMVRVGVGVVILLLMSLLWRERTINAEQRARLAEPRIAPVLKADWTDAQRELLTPFEESGRLYNVFTTMANHPELARDWLVFGGRVLNQSTLPPRERELLILRIGWLCQAEYEWGQHARIGKAAGLTDDEIERITEGPDADGWNVWDRTLLRAVDVVFTVGEYNLVSMALNSFGVQLDPGLDGFPR